MFGITIMKIILRKIKNIIPTLKEISHLREDERWLMMREGRPSDMVGLYLSPIINI